MTVIALFPSSSHFIFEKFAPARRRRLCGLASVFRFPYSPSVREVFFLLVTIFFFMFIYSAIILLHDPYAHVHSPGCVSAYKILEASRNILELIYAVYSTSFDVSLVDTFCGVRYLALWGFRSNR
jgi:hypothetical protein